MEPFTAPGRYSDATGDDDVVWSFRPSARGGWEGRYEIHAVICGVHVWGADLDGLEPVPGQAPGDRLALNRAGELSACVLSGCLPCTVVMGDVVVGRGVGFRLDLRDPTVTSGHLTLSCTVDGERYEVVDSWFEDGLLSLDKVLPAGVEIRSCVTCLLSDYSPGGHGLLGIRCHRDAREQYLAVRSKADYWPVPVTEEVPETYLCDEYERRVPGTGYRG